MSTKGYKHTAKTKEKMRKPHPSIAGENHPMYGKHHLKESLIKMSKMRKRWYENNPHPRGMLGKHHSKEMKLKLSIARKDENSYMWKGGKVSHWGDVARKTWEKYWREYVPSGYLIHHIDKNITNNNINNLALVTYSTHAKIHEFQNNLKGGINE